LLARAHPSIKEQLKLEAMQERVEKRTGSIERISKEIKDAKLDALIVVGDDQNEQYGEDNMPAILIYTGETIEIIRSIWMRTRRSSGAARGRNTMRTRPYVPIQWRQSLLCRSLAI
jgi:hypothetical protein